MADWRDLILNEFTPGVQPITVVADPDSLMTEPRLSQALMERGFEILLFEESISFRFAYESRFRSRLDRDEDVDLVILCCDKTSSRSNLPFDVLLIARRLSFGLADLFSQFSYSTLRAVDPQYLDMLYEAQGRFNPGVLGENATKDFVLRHVFAIAAELIKSDSDLLRTLLRRHYRPQLMSSVFVDRLVLVLRQSGRFEGWPLAELLTDRSLFLAFLQERWPTFLSRFGQIPLQEQARLRIDGPADLPFDHPDVRVYMDNLFREGLLQPIEWTYIPEGWTALGVRRDPQKERAKRFSAILETAEAELPEEDAGHGEWLSFARIWAEISLLTCEISTTTPKVREQVHNLRSQVDTRFAEWIQRRFGSLYSLPATPPVMVHQIARFLSRQLGVFSKVALVVVDGLAFDQWLVVHHELIKRHPGWRFDENATFAWVPTVTNVSRQAIFAGKAPFYFPSSIYSTGREASLWQQFWTEHGLAANQVGYLKGLGEPATLSLLEDALSDPKLKVLGAVVDKVDRIMHGMELGSAGMHNQVRQWASEGFLSALLERLLLKGFAIFLTADHGNVESLGCGRPKEGVTADVRGERARIYSDPVLRESVATRFPTAIVWKPLGLPEDFLPLLSPGRTAFVPEGNRTVAHGGVTLEEVIVPFVRIIGGGE